jgi:hypothetical protein
VRTVVTDLADFPHLAGLPHRGPEADVIGMLFYDLDALEEVPDGYRGLLKV